MDDTQVAREAFDAIVASDELRHDATAWAGFLACWRLKTPLPVAAALLRANGWTVEEPVCETCGGNGTLWIYNDAQGIGHQCPTCKGAGRRKVTP